MVRRKEGSEEGKGGPWETRASSSPLAPSCGILGQLLWLASSQGCLGLIRRLECWGPWEEVGAGEGERGQKGEGRRERRRNLVFTPRPPLVTYATHSWAPAACPGTCCGHGRDDPAGCAAWPGVWQGDTFKGLQPERAEGWPSQQGRVTRPWLNQKKIYIHLAATEVYSQNSGELTKTKSRTRKPEGPLPPAPSQEYDNL